MLQLFKKKAVVKTDADRIQAAQKDVDTALDLFASAKKKVDQANDNLSNVVSDIELKIAELDSLRISANTKIQSNNKISAKLAEFTTE